MATPDTAQPLQCIDARDLAAFTVSRFVRSHTGRADIWEPIGEALRGLSLPDE